MKMETREKLKNYHKRLHEKYRSEKDWAWTEQDRVLVKIKEKTANIYDLTAIKKYISWLDKKVLETM